MNTTNPFSIIIVEDDQHALAVLEKLLDDWIAPHYVQYKTDSIKEAKKAIIRYQPDLIFLDIELIDGSGFELLEQLPSIDFEIIFTTGFDQHAMKAFEFCALDYLLKPVENSAFQRALRRFEKISNVRQSNQANIEVLLQNLRENVGVKKIAVKETSGIHFIRIDSIIRCEAEGSYTRIHLKDRPALLASKSLKEFESLLEEDGFFRVHHSHLINLSLIERYKKGRGGVILMEDGTSVDVATRKKEELLRLLSK